LRLAELVAINRATSARTLGEAARAEKIAQRAAAERERVGARVRERAQRIEVAQRDAPTLPPGTAAFARSMAERVQSGKLTVDQARGAVEKYATAARAQASEVQATRAPVPAREHWTEGVKNFERSQRDAVAAGKLTAEQARRATERYAAHVNAKAPATGAPRPPRSWNARERALNDLVRKGVISKKDAREHMRDFRKEHPMAEGPGPTLKAGEPVPLEGSALRSGARGGSFMDNAAAASSFQDKYERSSLFDAERALSKVSVSDQHGNTFKIPDRVVEKGAEAMRAYVEKKGATVPGFDPQWVQYEAEDFYPDTDAEYQEGAA
jgi:polyhydroxyalkanoate synthesis regulator phasin